MKPNHTSKDAPCVLGTEEKYSNPVKWHSLFQLHPFKLQLDFLSLDLALYFYEFSHFFSLSSAGARFSKLPVITGLVKMICFPFQTGVSKRLKVVSAKETKWTSLELRTQPTFLETLISKYDFGPAKLTGLSRNRPQITIPKYKEIPGQFYSLFQWAKHINKTYKYFNLLLIVSAADKKNNNNKKIHIFHVTFSCLFC